MRECLLFAVTSIQSSCYCFLLGIVYGKYLLVVEVDAEELVDERSTEIELFVDPIECGFLKKKKVLSITLKF